MPATAGRVKMPANNRMYAGAALRTNDMWSKTIGHDPHAPEAEGGPLSPGTGALTEGALYEHAKVAAQSLRGEGSRGGCSKCGMPGHLSFQCRNDFQVEKKNVLDDISVSSVSSVSDVSSDESDEERKEKKRRKEGKAKKEKKEKKKKKEKREKKDRREKKERKDTKEKKERRDDRERRHHRSRHDDGGERHSRRDRDGGERHGDRKYETEREDSRSLSRTHHGGRERHSRREHKEERRSNDGMSRRDRDYDNSR